MKLVLLTFAGTKAHLKILFSYIIKYKKYINEYKLFVATTNKEDIDYMVNFKNNNEDFVKLEYYKENGNIILDNKNKIWDYAYSICQDEDTIYLKLDDDIVYMEESLFTDFIRYREKSKAPLLFPTIINNSYFSNLFSNNKTYNNSNNLKGNILTSWPDTYERIKPIVNSQRGSKNIKIGKITQLNEVLCPISWGNLNYCVGLHNLFIDKVKKNEIQSFYLENHIVPNRFPVSICCCSWKGKDLNRINNLVGNVFDDEPWWTIWMPTWLNEDNEVYGKTVVSHYSYYKQRELGLGNTDILSKYNDIINN
jgi:hypothetical protein